MGLRVTSDAAAGTWLVKKREVLSSKLAEMEKDALVKDNEAKAQQIAADKWVSLLKAIPRCYCYADDSQSCDERGATCEGNSST
jgi:hypothetical protein